MTEPELLDRGSGVTRMGIESPPAVIAGHDWTGSVVP